ALASGVMDSVWNNDLPRMIADADATRPCPAKNTLHYVETPSGYDIVTGGGVSPWSLQRLWERARDLADRMNGWLDALQSPGVALDGQPFAGSSETPDIDTGARVILSSAAGNVTLPSKP